MKRDKDGRVETEVIFSLDESDRLGFRREYTTVRCAGRVTLNGPQLTEFLYAAAERAEKLYGRTEPL